ncbi:cytochrome o ubiquinol oxidase subunit IV [Dyella soli]|uniref:Cytochrome bo(3) ubiquinol oxidase subunit 4 n=1 Tax=Dyella soli TaxID=522319 RepID=A0A4R0YN51_9GAMM|nr:cytochrome o ubiquinol oxidase subunit IV [Dyella soli]TCI10349.1 cytochrome o ubiquinol oxidase subunit IV [Dyella soli]
MSAHGDVQHGHDDHHDGHGHDDLGIHATLKGYLTGFVLASVLTIIPFWLVMTGGLEKSSTTAVVVLGLAAVQIIVHMIYFLHMNTKSEGGWNMLALVFTIVLVVITLSGSIWIMYHLNDNMMPGVMPDTSSVP